MFSIKKKSSDIERENPIYSGSRHKPFPAKDKYVSTKPVDLFNRFSSSRYQQFSNHSMELSKVSSDRTLFPNNTIEIKFASPVKSTSQV
jgi:hypothetical protein